jgi:hypothetical protein
MGNENKMKLLGEKSDIYFKQYYLKHLILSAHRGVLEIQRALVFSPSWIFIALHKLIKM